MESGTTSIGQLVREDAASARASGISTVAGARVTLRPEPIGRTLGAIAFVLIALNVATGVAGVGHRTFSLNGELNVPAYFSAVILLLASALLVWIGATKRRTGAPYALHWLALGGIFLFMSMDEAMRIHETVGERLRPHLDVSGIFYYESSLFTGALAIVVALAYLRFYLDLPRDAALLFGASAALFLGGAQGIEMIGGMYQEVNGYEDAGFTVLTTIEESLEITGVILFIYALLRYMARYLPEARLEVEPETR